MNEHQQTLLEEVSKIIMGFSVPMRTTSTSYNDLIWIGKWKGAGFLSLKR
jgi:hypothetical protein